MQRHKKKLLVLRLLASRLGRSYYNAYRLFNRADRWLLQTCPESFQGELIFMAVDPRFRHQGVALSLLGSFHAYMLSMGVGQICLFTDSACAVSFYDRQRFERLSTLYWPEKSALRRLPSICINSPISDKNRTSSRRIIKMS